MLVADLISVGNVNRQVTRLNRCSDLIDNRFICFMLRTLDFLHQFGSALAFIGLTKTKTFVIPIRPLSEQERMVSNVTELPSLCDALEAKVTQAESASPNSSPPPSITCFRCQLRDNGTLQCHPSD